VRNTLYDLACRVLKTGRDVLIKKPLALPYA
jgi:hypothetical protein